MLYKDQPIEKRLSEFNRVNAKYPTFTPVILEQRKHCKLPHLDNKKFLIPSNFTVGDFIFILRNKLKLHSNKVAIFIFIDNLIPPTSELFSTLYAEHKNKEDNFLYVIYTTENTFGN